MQSPEIVLKIIDKVDKWTGEELSKNVNEILPTLVLSLNEDLHKSLALRMLHILLDRCLQCVPISKIDSDIFQHTLPIARYIFNESLEGITVVLQDADNMEDEEVELSLKSLHHVCSGLLDQLSKVLLFIIKKCPISAEKVVSLPCYVLQLLERAFIFCRDSEELYVSSRELLIQFLENCCALLRSLEPLLLSGIRFNNSEESENLLKNVLDSLARVANATTNLGIRVQTVAWKMYVLLIEKYSIQASILSSCDLCSPVEILASSTSDILSLLLDPQFTDTSLGVKVLAVLNFLVRVLTRLCCIFAGNLSNSCMPSLIKLLSILNRCCVDGIETEETRLVLFKEAGSRVGVAASSLISSFVNDRSFIQVYFSSIEKGLEPEYSLGWLLIGASLCRTLLSSDAETLNMWINDSTENIFKCMFELIGSCHPELCSNVKFAAVNGPGKPARNTDLYEYILTSVGSLILLVPADKFPYIEQLLLNGIYQVDPWKAVFTIDLWCIIARQSPSHVRISHTTFLLEHLSSQEQVQCSPVQVHLRELLARLWPLVPPQAQPLLLKKYSPVSMPEVWDGVCFNMLPDGIELNDELLKVTSSVKNFVANPSLESYKDMFNKMKLAILLLRIQNTEKSSESALSNLATSLSKLWQLICINLLKFASEGWLFNFISLLINLTSLLFNVLNNFQILEILNKLIIIFSCPLPHVKLKILSALRVLAEKVFESDVQQCSVFSSIANIFICAVQDSNEIVLQEAVDTFEYFAHVTSHEEIIKSCLKSNKTVQERIAQYLKKTAVACKTNEKESSCTEYLKHQCLIVFSHQCKEKEVKPCIKKTTLSVCSNVEMTSKNISGLSNNTDADFESAIQRLQKDTHLVLNYCKQTHIIKPVQEKLLRDLSQMKHTIDVTCQILQD